MALCIQANLKANPRMGWNGDGSDELRVLVMLFYKQPETLKMLFCKSTTTTLLTTRLSRLRNTGTSNDEPNQKLAFTAAPDEVKARLSDADTIKRLLHRTRASHWPKDPQMLQALVIHNQGAQTAGDNSTNFLHYDNRPEADEHIIVFAIREHLRHLSSCETWCMEGTFSVVRHLFSQLLSRD